MKPICFYHKADLDGVCSGAIVKHFVPECELYGIDYGDEFPWEKARILVPEEGLSQEQFEEQGGMHKLVLGPKRTVYMVDFSLPVEDMRELAEFSNLIWIDHHKTAIEGCNDLNLRGLTSTEQAACELTWRWFSEKPLLEYSIPEAVRLLGVYDSWRSDDPEWDCWVMPFQYGLRSVDDIYDPCSIWWRMLFIPGAQFREDEIEDVWLGIPEFVDRGRAILKFQKQQNDRIAKAGAFDVTLWVGPESWKAIVINTPVFNSQAFEAVWDPDLYDVMIPFAYQTVGKWKCSLYSTKPDVDCGKIAKAFGGGGHKGAAGFMCDELPWMDTVRR